MSCDACFSDLNYEQYRAEHYRHDDVGSSDAGVEMRYENKAPEDEDDENEIAIDDGDRVQHYGVFGLGDGGLQHEHGNNEILLVVAEDDREILQHVQDLFSEMKGCDNRANRRKFFKCLRRHPSLRDFFGLPQNSQEGPWREIFEFIANTDNQSRDKFTEDRWIVRTREFQEKQRIGP